MKIYPSIPNIKQLNSFNYNEVGYSFYKYDGSNLRFEWDKKKGWYKLGTRHQLFDENTEIYNQSLLILDKYKDSIINKLSKFHKITNITCYMEFYGNNSFAGKHDSNEEKYLKLFDVNIYKYGFIEPKQFIEIFSDMDYSAELLYTGCLTQDYINSVKESEELNEGVIFKSGSKHNINMVKIKTNHYLNKLKLLYGNEWENYV